MWSGAEDCVLGFRVKFRASGFLGLGFRRDNAPDGLQGVLQVYILAARKP